jgi:hypothetical protein
VCQFTSCSKGKSNGIYLPKDREYCTKARFIRFALLVQAGLPIPEAKALSNQRSAWFKRGLHAKRGMTLVKVDNGAPFI